MEPEDNEQAMQNRVSKMEAAIQQLQAELEWVKVAMQGRVPAETAKKTKPPILGPILVALIGAVGAVAAARPWT